MLLWLHAGLHCQGLELAFSADKAQLNQQQRRLVCFAGFYCLLILFFAQSSSRHEILALCFSMISQDPCLDTKVCFCEVLEAICANDLSNVNYTKFTGANIPSLRVCESLCTQRVSANYRGKGFLLDYLSCLQDWLGYISTFNIHISSRLLTALLPMVKISPGFSDFCFKTLSKHFHARDHAARCIATVGYGILFCSGLVVSPEHQVQVLRTLCKGVSYSLEVRCGIYNAVTVILQKHCNLIAEGEAGLLTDDAFSFLQKMVLSQLLPCLEVVASSELAFCHRACFVDSPSDEGVFQREAAGHLFHCCLLLATIHSYVATEDGQEEDSLSMSCKAVALSLAKHCLKDSTPLKRALSKLQSKEEEPAYLSHPVVASSLNQRRECERALPKVERALFQMDLYASALNYQFNYSNYYCSNSEECPFPLPETLDLYDAYCSSRSVCPAADANRGRVDILPECVVILLEATEKDVSQVDLLATGLELIDTYLRTSSEPFPCLCPFRYLSRSLEALLALCQKVIPVLLDILFEMLKYVWGNVESSSSKDIQTATFLCSKVFQLFDTFATLVRTYFTKDCACILPLSTLQQYIGKYDLDFPSLHLSLSLSLSVCVCM